MVVIYQWIAVNTSMFDIKTLATSHIQIYITGMLKWLKYKHSFYWFFLSHFHNLHGQFESNIELPVLKHILWKLLFHFVCCTLLPWGEGSLFQWTRECRVHPTILLLRRGVMLKVKSIKSNVSSGIWVKE